MRFTFVYAFAPVLLAPAMLVSLLPSGCNTAKLVYGPDASPDCTPKPEYPCQPAEAGVPACGALTVRKSQVETYFDIDASYPEGCTVLVNDPSPDDSNQCVQIGSCRCNSDDAGALSWRCLPPTP